MLEKFPVNKPTDSQHPSFLGNSRSCLGAHDMDSGLRLPDLNSGPNNISWAIQSKLSVLRVPICEMEMMQHKLQWGVVHIK